MRPDDPFVARVLASVRLGMTREEMRAARQSGQQMSPETMQQMRALQTEQRDAIRAILTPEQQATFDRNLAAMPQARHPCRRTAG